MVTAKIKVKNLTSASANFRKNCAGFTLMEILVASTIFAFVVASLMSMFNYTLKINRRTDALRQASQGMRDLTEFIVKEVRDGQIDYGIVNGTTKNPDPFYSSSINNPCKSPLVGAAVGSMTPVSNTYLLQDNKLAILTSNKLYECIFLAEGAVVRDPGTQLGDPLAGSSAGSLTSTPTNPNPVLAMLKSNLSMSSPEILTPTNISVQKLAFIVRPSCDPYAPDCVDSPYSGYTKIQPFVTILAQFLLTLPTGEKIITNYQTTVSSGQYDIPNH